MPAFVKGRSKTGGGSRAGSRHKISNALLAAFAADFAQFGAETIITTRIEKPVEYLKIAVSLIPQSIEIDDQSQLGDLSDAELDAVIEYVLKRRLAAGETEGRENETSH